MSVDHRRITVDPQQRFVVFLIGMRANRWWHLPAVAAVAAGMTRMMNQLMRNPADGLLHAESWFGRTTLMVQYWQSVEHLDRYAHNKEREHVPAWKQWVRKVGRGAVGIWHETYVIEPGQYECVYVHMPRFGLGNVLERVEAEGPLKTARGRLEAGRAAPQPQVALPRAA